MGVISYLLTSLFGGARNVPVELINAIRGNAENAAERSGEFDAAALQQFAAEFRHPSRNWFDGLVDWLNRLPRPLLTLGAIVILLLPVWDIGLATAVFTAWSIIPPAIWALITVVVTFFFGGRMQAQDLSFNRDLAATAAALPTVMGQLREIRELTAETPLVAATERDAAATIDAVQSEDNPALSAWRAGGSAS
jgi:hypothetical protein